MLERVLIIIIYDYYCWASAQAFSPDSQAQSLSCGQQHQMHAGLCIPFMYTCHRYQLCLPFAGSNIYFCLLALGSYIGSSSSLFLSHCPSFPIFQLLFATWPQGHQVLRRGPRLRQHPHLAPPEGAPTNTMPAQGSARALMRASSAQAAPSTLCACLQTRYSSTLPTFQQQLQLQMLFQTGGLHFQHLVCLAVACLCNTTAYCDFD